MRALIATAVMLVLPFCASARDVGQFGVLGSGWGSPSAMTLYHRLLNPTTRRLDPAIIMQIAHHRAARALIALL